MGTQSAMPSTEHRIHEATRERVRRLRHPEDPYIILAKGGLNIELDKRNGVLSLRGSVERHGEDGRVNAAVAGKLYR